mgnify:CR=1 FL=1
MHVLGVGPGVGSAVGRGKALIDSVAEAPLVFSGIVPGSETSLQDLAGVRVTDCKTPTRRKASFAVDNLIASAQTDAGINDAAWLDDEPLRRLSGSLDRDGPLSGMGRNRASRMLVETLVKRLRVQSYLERFPEIQARALDRPIALVGPPRTGTTFLHRLLSKDPANRTPRLWEVLQAPPLEPRLRDDPRYFSADSRVEVLREHLASRARFLPKMQRIHATSVDAPEECFGLLESSLLSHSFMVYGPAWSYLEWLSDLPDDRWQAVYRLYADQLRILDWFASARRWVVKTPFHLWAMGALSEALPGLFFVQLHRSPVTCAASFASLMVEAYKPIAPKVPVPVIGRFALDYLRQAVQRAARARVALPSGQVLDIQYSELVADPMGQVRRIYDAAGLQLEPEAERAMIAWLADPGAGGARGRHDYELAEYGLGVDEVDEAFAPYEALASHAR